MTRKTSFYFSFLVLPRPKRDAVTAVYDVCRAIDDSVDLQPDPAQGAAALDRWRTEIARVFEGRTPATPEGRRLQTFVKPFHLPRAQFEALIEGVATDIGATRFATFAELEPYCHRVASAVGLMCAEIFGYTDQATLAYARDLGVALQLTNILRDVAVDLRINHRYLPEEDLRKFGVTEADLVAEIKRAGGGVQSPAVRELLAFEAARARSFFALATRALPAADAAKFLPAEIMRAVYEALLDKIEAAGYDVFTRVIRVPRPAQAWLAIQTWRRLR